MFGVILLVLCIAIGLANLVCFIIMQRTMVKNNESGMATLSTFLFCCTGVGILFAFIYGWTKAKQWGIEEFMRIWSVIFGGGAVLFTILQIFSRVAS
jgi:nitric oxide reductase large subunit